MTSLPGHEGEVDLLEIENRKAIKNTEKALAAVKIRIADDFMRRQLDKELSNKLDKASRAAKQLMTLSIKHRAEANQKTRDEKIKMIKIN